MPDYGLLKTMADGIREGMIAYNTVSHQRRMEEQLAKANKLDMLKQGMTEANGEIQYNPETKSMLDAEKKSKGLLSNRSIETMDPSSASSARARDYYRKQGLDVPEDASFQDLKDLGASGFLSASARNDQAERLARMRLDDAKEERSFKREQGKLVPASEAVALGGASASVKALEDAEIAMKENADLSGPLKGRVTGLLGKMEVGDTGERAKKLNAQLKLNAQSIGKYLEGGKLTDADIERYREMLPNLNDSEEVAQAKSAHIRKLIRDKQSQELSSLKEAGYKTDKLEGGLLRDREGEDLKGLAPGDRAAVEWARANPNDPRAAAVLKKAGVK